MIKINWNELELEFKTSEQVFSPNSLDRGTKAMLSMATFQKGDKVLDLGCGYGPVGIIAAKIIGSEKVTMCDISEEAVALAKENAIHNEVGNVTILQSDGLNNIAEDNFTLILSNPPYHVDFNVPKGFIEQGYKKLSIGGKMLMVTKRKDWYKNKLISVFGGVKVEEIDGYYVFIAEKRGNVVKKKKKDNGNTLSKKLARKQMRTSNNRANK
ncbi:class I SAM-dependent methyltransferase [Clostridium sp. Marseille-P299]|uniref:class I SAM-dependent methyltransferase n=1 Tax=Clostridium sp. Marseille-P299 TaxID=1805477 RepID=UPI0008376D9B|nr:methyltransferase [Clostridium sp. Marseille-P299]